MASPACKTPNNKPSDHSASGPVPIPIPAPTTTVPTSSPSSSYPPPLPTPFHFTSPAPQLITQGAEALLYRTHFLEPSQPAALKIRPSKSWRHPTLDARLTKQRVLAEARVLVRLSGVSGVNVPGVFGVEWDLGRKSKGLAASQTDSTSSSTSRPGSGSGAWLLMEWIKGKSVKELLRQGDRWCKTVPGPSTKEIDRYDEDHVRPLLRKIGRAVGVLHANGGTVHGDLTTSNIMVRHKPKSVSGGRPGVVNGSHTPNDDNEDTIDDVNTTVAPATAENSRTDPPNLTGDIVLIDFGLATQSIQDEDRAVDLYVLERAFGSTHPRQETWFVAEVLQHPEGYRGGFRGSQVVLKRLEEVRLRGRKRSMIG